MLGAFLLGMLTTTATERGAMAGIGVSLVAMIGVRVFTPLAWTWYVLVGTVICVAVGMMVSLLEEGPAARRDARRGEVGRDWKESTRRDRM